MDQVRARAERDRQMLESGSGSAKDLENIQHELESLAKRQADLEDVVLEVMEKVESSATRTAKLAADRAEVEARPANEPRTRWPQEQAGVDKDVEFARSQRELVVKQIPAPLLGSTPSCASSTTAWPWRHSAAALPGLPDRAGHRRGQRGQVGVP